jgi:hypothetical protein
MSAGRKAISEKKDWNTPPKYTNVIKEFFGRIDLDPCTNENSTISALTEYKLPTDGLKESWNFKNIYVNPPYGRDMERKTSISDWLLKGSESHKNHGSELLFLIPVATNTKHFKNIIFENGGGICFLKDTRLKFWADGLEDKKGAPMACCMVYFGKDYEKFEEYFTEYGKCFKIT